MSASDNETMTTEQFVAELAEQVKRLAEDVAQMAESVGAMIGQNSARLTRLEASLGHEMTKIARLQDELYGDGEHSKGVLAGE